MAIKNRNRVIERIESIIIAINIAIISAIII